jgi:uncharacterized surface protein with fasciclin (FAS1) repeats
MKKRFEFFLVSMMLILFACQPAQENTATKAGVDDSAAIETKGQSAVKDDLSAKNILQVAIGSKDHSTLVAGVQAAGLEDVLVNAGPLTVFAPTNTAFDALPDGALDDLLKPENKKALSRIIKLHASPGSYTTALLKDGQKLFQASGHYLDVVKNDDGITVGGAKILGTVMASNGIVHVVDKVLLPPD